MLGGGAERFSARRKQPGRRCVRHEPAGEDRRGRQDVLAIVQNDQHLPRSQIVDGRSQAVVRIAPDAEGRHQSGAEQRRVGDRCEIDEAHAVAALWRKCLGYSQGNRRLADSSCANQSHMPVAGQQTRDFVDFRFTTDDAAQQWRIGRGERFGERKIVLDLADADLHLRDELISAACHGRDVDGLDLGISQRTPQAPHVDLEIAVVEEGARPGGRHQLILADQLAAALHQQLQKLECASTQFDGAPFEKKQLAAGNESKRAEAVGELPPVCAPLSYLRGSPHCSLPIDRTDRP